MAQKAAEHSLSFRPHFKTHQSARIGGWFRAEGVDKITVSSVTMAEYFAKSGWNDILIAFPLNHPEIQQINKLAGKINLSVTIEALETIDYLNKKLHNKTGVYIKIDAGYHRTGIGWNHLDEIEKIIVSINKTANLNFVGFLVHSGHTYQAKNLHEIQEIHDDSLRKLSALQSRFTDEDFRPLVSIGDTPSCSTVNNFEGVDEIRPGNFVFYDIMQFQLGSCKQEDIAVALACPVVAKHPNRNEFIIYGGAIHLSKEFINDFTGRINYGLIVNLESNRWGNPVNGAFVKSLSQEHGVIQTTREHLKALKIGDIIGILPVHSCLTSSQMKYYFTFDGKHINKMH